MSEYPPELLAIIDPWLSENIDAARDMERAYHLGLAIGEHDSRLMFERGPVSHSDTGLTLISQAITRAEASLTDEQRAWLQAQAEAMSPADWDAFAAVAIRPARPEDLFPADGES